MPRPDNRLTRLLNSDKQQLLSIYFTAGFPQIDSTVSVIKALEAGGADLLEIGIPFSDPLADGPAIQKSSMQAIQNGMTLSLLFEQLSGLQCNVPLILMGYFNSILQYGVEAFCRKCADTGIDGLILPDLPIEIYAEKYDALFRECNLCSIFLVTARTSDERIRMIDSHSTGFIYAVSSASTTGTKAFSGDATEYLRRLKGMDLEHPILTGFNIHDAKSFAEATAFTRGGIIGSAFIRQLAEGKITNQDIASFLKQIKP